MLKRWNCTPNLLLILSLFFQACAREKEAPTFDLQGAETSLGVIEVAPSEVGGAWKRRIQVRSPTSAFLTIEKKIRGAKDWQAIGFSDEQGTFTDDEATLPAEYWVGRQWKTKPLPGLNDLVLEGTLTANSRFEAHRIVVPKILELRGYHVIIEAKIFQIDGQLRAFDPLSEGGLSAGSLIVSARSLVGRGKILLEGQKGRRGDQGESGAAGQEGNYARGKDGSPGGVGGQGQTGGSGGQLWIQADTVDPSLQISVAGAAGGKGGAGGNGGAGGQGGYHLGGMDSSMTPHPSGRPGASGPEGKEGDPGKEGRVLISPSQKD